MPSGLPGRLGWKLKGKSMHREIILLLGSNIDPVRNIAKAVRTLNKHFPIKAISSAWQSHPEGGSGDDYHNIAISISSDLPLDEIKNIYIHEIEQNLGRVRSEDKNAPRTIDIDIVVVGEDVVDQKIWRYAFIAVPVAQIKPNLMSPVYGQTLALHAEGLKKISWLHELPAYPLELSRDENLEM